MSSELRNAVIRAAHAAAELMSALANVAQERAAETDFVDAQFSVISPTWEIRTQLVELLDGIADADVDAGTLIHVPQFVTEIAEADSFWDRPCEPGQSPDSLDEPSTASESGLGLGEVVGCQ